MKTVSIKANKSLFDKWLLLSERICNLNNIVQNDMDVSIGELLNWVLELKKCEDGLKELGIETSIYLSIEL